MTWLARTPVSLLLCLLFAGLCAWCDGATDGELHDIPASCTNILVGKDASASGRAMISYSCDGATYGRVQVVHGQTYPTGSTVVIYENPPYGAYEEYLALMRDLGAVGTIPQVERTFQYIDLIGWYGAHWGGMNEAGVTIFETTIGGRPELVNPQGIFGIGAQISPESSLLVLALQRASTARAAIEIMGELAELYGYHQPRFHGEHLSITDGEEIWIMEIFGPGPDWSPGSQQPGAVWCAKRLPDDHVGVSANRSRIGAIDFDDSENVMCSLNAVSLAVEMGWWDPSGNREFLWYEAYAPSDFEYCSLREWRVLDVLAPSRGLDADDGRYPLSARPDHEVTLEDLMQLHRDFYAGTPYDAGRTVAEDLTSDQAALIYPYRRYSWIDDPVQDVLGVDPQRTIAVWSAFSCIAEVTPDPNPGPGRNHPHPLTGCLWYGQGPAATTCYLPIYSGVTDVPSAWSQTDPTQIDWESAHWAFSLVHELARHGGWQDSLSAVESVRRPAEESLREIQDEVRRHVQDALLQHGIEAAQSLLTGWTSAWMTEIVETYWQLVDYLLFTHYFPGSYRDPLQLPRIALPDLDSLPAFSP